MLLHTFRHILGVGPARERILWSSGCHTWHHVLYGHFRTEDLAGLPGPLLDRIRCDLEADLDAFESRDLGYLANRIAMKDHWRLYRYFSDNTAFVDIETTGMDPSSSIVTVIGLYDPLDPDRTRVFIDGYNLDTFPTAIASYDLVVTFNGTCFDLPFLRSAFRDIDLPQIHIDLRWLCREVGLTGGLKNIERQIGICRHASVLGFSGTEAVTLWQRYVCQHDIDALHLLIRYNLEDTFNLHRLLIHSLNQMYLRHPFLNIDPLPEPTHVDLLNVGELIERAGAQNQHLEA